ncbi:MAG: hypothetical protein KGN76_02450 [Acidobacteriota bacterium]|nr:hypothetical protein [Acidobacteriota bacterium]
MAPSGIWRQLTAVCMCVGIAGAVVVLAQGHHAPGATGEHPLHYITSVNDQVVFFFENGLDPDTGEPMAPPSVPLAPITDWKVIEFETGSVVIPHDTVHDLLQVDVYLRQRYQYRNDGQSDGFTIISNPFIEIDSPAFDHLTDPVTGTPMNGVWKSAVLGNGLFLGTTKTLAAGETGEDNRGNFGRQIITREGLDRRFGPGIGLKLFSSDFTIRMSIRSTVHGVPTLVEGTITQVYGE